MTFDDSENLRSVSDSNDTTLAYLRGCAHILARMKHEVGHDNPVVAYELARLQTELNRRYGLEVCRKVGL